MKTLLVAALVASPLAAAAPSAAAADCGKLPAVVQGNPMVQAGQRGIAYLYHGTNGWGLRVTHASKAKITITGTIKASSAISHYRTYRLERGDAVALSADGRLMSFRLTNVGGLDGFDFQAECSHQLTLNVKVDGQQIPTTRAYLGKDRVHPTSVPFTIERH
jgi:opacity protein-like surface antigen